MTNFKFHDLVRFFRLVGRLKRIQRSGWVEIGIPDPESVADHILRTAFLCMIYSNLAGLDESKLLRMALIHDLPEAIIGDLTPSKKPPTINDEENEAMEQILNLLPKTLRKNLLADWREYRDGKTREAKAVSQLEKLEMALQATEYRDAESSAGSLRRFVTSAEASIYWPELKDLLSHILEDRPDQADSSD